jgi:hypothetical protein
VGGPGLAFETWVFRARPIACSATFLVEPPSPLSSRPERTRISYFALLATPTFAALREESRMQTMKATGLHRKSGGAQWRDLCVDALSWKCFSTEGTGLRFASAELPKACGTSLLLAPSPALHGWCTQTDRRQKQLHPHPYLCSANQPDRRCPGSSPAR